MEEFLKYKDWFTEKYSYKPTQRFWTFKAALNIFLQRDLATIVETGTTRHADDWGAGMSTTIFGDFCKVFGKRLWTVDIDPEAIKQCQIITEEYKDELSYVTSDSVAFLESFDQEIHLLYLDSFDCPIEEPIDFAQLKTAQEHQLKEIKAAWHRLTDSSIILLDDSGFETGGKTELTRRFLREKGWMEVLNQQQSLWIKK